MASWVPFPFYLYLCVKSVYPSGPWFPLKRSVDIYVSFRVQSTPQGQEWHLIGHHQNVQFLDTRDKTPQNREHKIYCLNWLLLRVKDINNYAGKAGINIQIKSECIITPLQGSLTANKGQTSLDQICRCELSTIVPLYCEWHDPIPQWVPESINSTELHTYYDTDLSQCNL